MANKELIKAAIEATQEQAMLEVRSLIQRATSAESRGDITHLAHNVATIATALAKIEGEMQMLRALEAGWGE